MRFATDAAPQPAPIPDPADARPAPRLLRAAATLLGSLERGEALDARTLREAMTDAFGATDSAGAWVWKDAYEACEAVLLLFLRRHFPAMRARAGSNARLLAMLGKLAALTPTHTRRSEESQQLQQFSTPIELGFIAALAASLTPADQVLEPSAGTGQLAVFAELHGAHLALNEIAATRADLLGLLFPGAPITRFNGEQIHDYLPDAVVRPTVILMNPPFSAALHVKGPAAGTDFRHVRAALHRLAPGGRLVTLTGANVSPHHPDYRQAFAELAELGRVVFSAGVSGALYRRHGTTIETRLTVIDRVPASEPPGDVTCHPMAESAVALLDLVTTHVPARKVAEPVSSPRQARLLPLPAPTPGARKVHLLPAAVPSPAEPAIELTYIYVEDADPPAAPLAGDAIYEAYRVETIRIEGAKPHPTRLVQSAAMASVKSPKPAYCPHLPARVVTEGLLSDAQLESVIYAGEAHTRHLAGLWKVGANLDVITASDAGDDDAVRFRRGWFLGDGTGAGKGRQVAGILLDNWLKGRRRALWVSKSDKLIEDAQRDWTALGQEKLHIVPQSRFRQGRPITLNEGILFTTYATLRSSEREGKASRLKQIIDWLVAASGDAAAFDGIIVFDESHAMANAAGDKTERGERAASQQGLAGLRLQHALPNARVVYVSATGATTVENLAYTQRLGLWGANSASDAGMPAAQDADDAKAPSPTEAGAPFATRAQFVAAMQQGGIAAMEVLARDLKALGLYAARSLSYEGVEVEMLEHKLTPEQVRIYDAYAGAFQVIHQNLDAALKAVNVTGDEGTLNRQAKAAARSAFESNKQRFFNHLITAMKCPTLIRAIEADLAEGRAAVVQLVSTSEALMERRLAHIPAGEWSDLSVDVTPREYVLDYLAHSFPTQLHETYTDDNGNLLSRPVFVDGQPVHSKEAEARRDRLIEHLAALPPVQGALDQILHHFGTDHVAEVTGRGRRIVRRARGGGMVLAVENRPPSSNLAETQAFMDGKKNILVFSDAGGTGRSYHADLAARNQRRRVHYLLEAGWKADTAIQGLGRTNRTNQNEPPLFRPVATDVRGEKRFLSTIARRLDSLGAITRGQRQTGGQGLFRAEDNLESPYARSALRRLYALLHRGHADCCSLEKFQKATGLNLLDGDGSLREELPPITTFLNRMLALEIDLQNAVFATFEELLEAQIESAMAAGTYEVGLETIRAESLKVTDRRTIATHAATASETQLYEVARKDRNQPLTLAEALQLAQSRGGILLANRQSGRAAVQLPAPSLTLDAGTIERRVRLVRPMERPTMPSEALAETHWRMTDVPIFSELWTRELETVPEFTESRFHLVTGLLLPIWKQLPKDNPRVYRFQTDDGERVIGRLLPPEFVDAFTSRDTPLTPDEAWLALNDGRCLPLAGGLFLRRVTVMHAPRIELTGFDADDVPGLKAKGFIGEIIAWKLRLFLPVSDEGPAILGKLLHSHPVIAAPAPKA